MTDATELDEAGISARVEAATEGPWEAVEGSSGGWWIEGHRATVAEIDIDHMTPAADAEFIAHARTDLPAALDEITRLRAALDEARAEVVYLRQAHHAMTEAAADERDRVKGTTELDRNSDIEALIERSSLGSPEAKEARESVPREIGTAIALAAKYLAQAEAAESALAAVRALVTSEQAEIDRINATPDPLTGRCSTMRAYVLVEELAPLLDSAPAPQPDKEHFLDGEIGHQNCSCGWTPRLGDHVYRAFDRHLLETTPPTTDAEEATEA